MLADYRAALHEIEKAEKWVAKADAVPLATDDYHARVEEARTYLREAMTAAHSVQPDVMASYTRAGALGGHRGAATELEHELKNMHDRASSLLVVFWFYVLVTVGILRRFRDRARTEPT